MNHYAGDEKWYYTHKYEVEEDVSIVDVKDTSKVNAPLRLNCWKVVETEMILHCLFQENMDG